MSQEYITKKYHWHVSKVYQTSLKQNSKWQFGGTLPRRLSGESSRCCTRKLIPDYVSVIFLLHVFELPSHGSLLVRPFDVVKQAWHDLQLIGFVF